jgi:hypothetical protein
MTAVDIANTAGVAESYVRKVRQQIEKRLSIAQSDSDSSKPTVVYREQTESRVSKSNALSDSSKQVVVTKRGQRRPRKYKKREGKPVSHIDHIAERQTVHMRTV